MAQFGYVVAGFGSYTSRGIAVGTWIAELDGLDSSLFAVGHAGNGDAGTIFGGYSGSQTNATEEWNGSVWVAGGNLNLESHGTQGAGSQTSCIKIAGDTDMDGTRNFVECEQYDGSSWTSTTNTSLNHSEAAVGGTSKDNCTVALGGETKAETWNGSSWSTGSDNSTTRRDAVASGQSGGSGDMMVCGGKTTDGTLQTTVQKYDDTWSALASQPVATKAQGAFGNTNSADVIVFGGETASAGNGVANTYEFNNGAWTTGNSLTRERRNAGGTGPSGKGLTGGGYDGSFRNYTDTFDRPGHST